MSDILKCTDGTAHPPHKWVETKAGLNSYSRTIRFCPGNYFEKE